MTLWMVVNLNGSYNIEVEVPLEVGSVPEGMALVDAIPHETIAAPGRGGCVFSTCSNVIAPATGCRRFSERTTLDSSTVS